MPRKKVVKSLPKISAPKSELPNQEGFVKKIPTYSSLGEVKPFLRDTFSNQKKLTRLILVFGTISALAAIFFFIKFTEIKNNPTKEVDRQTKDLIEKVSKLIILPKDEVPTIATVKSLDELRGQPFFLNAKEGFKVLIYTNAKKAILYDPFQDKIVEIAPINLGQPVP